MAYKNQKKNKRHTAEIHKLTAHRRCASKRYRRDKKNGSKLKMSQEQLELLISRM